LSHIFLIDFLGANEINGSKKFGTFFVLSLQLETKKSSPLLLFLLFHLKEKKNSKIWFFS